MSKPELKPCPFCGAENHFVGITDYGHLVSVVCSGCAATISRRPKNHPSRVGQPIFSCEKYVPDDDCSEVVGAWNRRVV